VVLGSDCHSLEGRPCRLKEACDKIQKKWGQYSLDTILQNAEKLMTETL